MRPYGEWYRDSLCRNDKKIQAKFLESDKTAKDNCANCPVRSDCFQFGLLYNEKGIWGGTTDAERAVIKTRSPQIKSLLEKEAKSLGIYEARYSIEQYWAEVRASRKILLQVTHTQVVAQIAPEPIRSVIERLWAELNIQ